MCEYKKLTEICSPKQWKTISQKDMTQDGYPVYGANGIIGYYNKYNHEKPTVMVTCRGATCGVINISKPFSWINGNAMSLDNVSNDVIEKYLYYYLKNRGLRDVISGSAQPQITIQNLSKIKVLCPNIEEQQRIVKILDKAEEIRTKKKLANEKLDEFLKSTFIDMFGDPVTNPYEYKITNIGEACYFVKDGPHKSPTYVQEGVPFISVNNIISGKWDFSKVKYISKEDHYMFKKRCHAVKGDILYTKGGTTGFAKLVDIDIEFSNWVHLAVLKFDNNILNGKFFEYMLNSKYCYAQSQRRTRGIANRDLVLGEMKKIAFYLPPIEEQKNFERIALKVEAQKEKNQKVIEQMDNLFNSLMQQAFNGEL